MDRRAWWATVHGVTISLKDTSTKKKKKILQLSFLFLVSFKLILLYAVNPALWVYECLLDHSLCFTAVSQFSPKWFWVDFSIGKLESHSVTIPLSGSSTSPVMRAYVGRNCSKRTFTWCTFPGQEAKEFYSCLRNVEKIKEGLETRKNKIFCQRVGRRSGRGITRI